jgi:hypothetical protein
MKQEYETRDDDLKFETAPKQSGCYTESIIVYILRDVFALYCIIHY